MKYENRKKYHQKLVCAKLLIGSEIFFIPCLQEGDDNSKTQRKRQGKNVLNEKRCIVYG